MRVDGEDFARSCSCGEVHKVSVRDVIIESGAVEELEERMADGDLKEYISPLLLCDTNTYQATIEPMEDIYERCQVITLQAEGLCADAYAVEIIQSIMEEDIDLMLAVGSGVIHDLCRYVAHQQGIPYISVPTAVSPGGFAASAAVMLLQDEKKLIPTEGPLSVIGDTRIFAAAPARLAASGLSDFLGICICLADWKIAHILTGEYFCEEICRMLERAIKEVKSCAKGIGQGDEDACEKLLYGLVLADMAVQMAGSFRPVTGIRQSFWELWEMEMFGGPIHALYGEQMGIAMLLCLKEYKRIGEAIRKGRCQVLEYGGMEEELLEETFGKEGRLEDIRRANTPDPLEEITREELEECLPQIGDVLEELPPVEEIEELLQKAGCVCRPLDIGLSRENLFLSVKLSPYLCNSLSLMRLRKMLEVQL